MSSTFLDYFFIDSRRNIGWCNNKFKFFSIWSNSSNSDLRKKNEHWDIYHRKTSIEKPKTALIVRDDEDKKCISVSNVRDIYKEIMAKISSNTYNKSNQPALYSSDFLVPSQINKSSCLPIVFFSVHLYIWAYDTSNNSLKSYIQHNESSSISSPKAMNCGG